MYDKDFEKFWNNIRKIELQFKPPKDFAYLIWQSARATKPEKQSIELEGGEFDVYTSVLNNNNGRDRKTEKDAQKAAEPMLKRDRLAAFVYEHCGVESEFGEKCNYYIYIDSDDEYCYVPEDEFPDLCKQYMPKETAIWLCEKLNSGEIVL